MNTTKHESRTRPNLIRLVLDAVLSIFLNGVKILGWMVIIYVLLFTVIGGDFSASIHWENVSDFWDALNGI